VQNYLHGSAEERERLGREVDQGVKVVEMKKRGLLF
jgi:hypothetical protein